MGISQIATNGRIFFYDILSQIFIVKCFTKSLLIRIKRDNKVHLFRRLEKCTKRLVKCERPIEFLRLCMNFDVVPTFAQVERGKARKWRKSADNYQREVLVEELRCKQSHLLHLKGIVYKAHQALREECLTLRYVAATHVLSALRNDLHKDLMRIHSNKIYRLISKISKKLDVDEHIKNISSYRLAFFEKLVICRGLKFSLPQKVSPIDVQANFEKLYWKIDDKLSDPNLKELAVSTLRSIALNYIQRKSPNPPKALVDHEALNRLKERDDIVITRPDKGLVVVAVFFRWIQHEHTARSDNFI